VAEKAPKQLSGPKEGHERDRLSGETFISDEEKKVELWGLGGGKGRDRPIYR